jgi:hypothetical protein
MSELRKKLLVMHLSAGSYVKRKMCVPVQSCPVFLLYCCVRDLMEALVTALHCIMSTLHMLVLCRDGEWVCFKASLGLCEMQHLHQ